MDKMIFEEYLNCNLCARECGVDRYASLGACNSPAEIKLARAALHFWEEPPISGSRGSGAIFFSGCSLSCSFCQNYEISRGKLGCEVSVGRLSEIMLELEAQGAHNINLVTPTHYVPSIRAAIITARERGLSVPIVYNTGSFDSPKTLELLRGLIDIYLADYKFYTQKSSREFARAPSYPESAMAAIDEMYSQVGLPQFDGEIMRRGIIIRLLELPGHSAEAKLSLSRLYKRYGNSVYFSLMNQFTPTNDAKPPLNRPVSREEYRELVSYAERLGVKNAFVQEFGTADSSFIPNFDMTGI